MFTVPSNKNITIHNDNHYMGLGIQYEKGPFIREYLHRLYETINRATSQYREVYAFRFDLRLPAHFSQHNLAYENEYVDRFIASFKAKIRHNRKIASQKNAGAHDSTVRYVWAREVGQHGRPHYHFAVLLNKDAYCALGTFALGKDNMFNRLSEAWASALGVAVGAVTGLVEIPQHPNYYLHRQDPPSIAAFFFRASYLCKAATKTFGHGGHGFGASRS